MNRKTENIERRIFFIKTCIFLIVIACFLTVGYSILSQDLSVSMAATIGHESSEMDLFVDDKTTLNKWSNGDKYTYQYNLSLRYEGSLNLASWYAKFDVPDDSVLDNCWSAICKISDGYLYMYSGDYDYKLSSDKLISPVPAFQITTSSVNYEMALVESKIYSSVNDNPNAVEVDSSKVDASISIGGGWQNGNSYVKQAYLSISNNSGVKLNYWQVGILIPDGTTVSNIWNASYIIKDNYLYLYGEGSNSLLNNSSVNSGMELILPIDISTLSIDSTVYKTIKIE